MPPELFIPDSMALLSTLLEDAEPVRHGVAVFCLFSLQEKRGWLLPARDIWPAAAKALGDDVPLEYGFPKPRSEFLVYGACHEPRPVAASQARISVGQLDKSLYVFGDRSWSLHGGKRTEDFTRMPLDHAHAFGGPQFGQNPLGKGHSSCENDTLPNVESPHHLVTKPEDAPPPAGFCAMPADWPQRTQYLGHFDDAWLRDRWPYFPEGTDPEYYCTAPPDQRFAGYLHGDEELCIENMHPERACIHSALPGKRCRLFSKGRESDEAGCFQELHTVAETLWLLPEQECGVLLFRAGFLSQDDEASDIESFHAAWEDLDSPPLPASQYVRLFEEQIKQKREAVPKPPVPTPEPDDTSPAKPAARSTPLPKSAPPPPPAALGEIDKALAAFEAETRKHLALQGWSKGDIEKALADEAPEDGLEHAGPAEEEEDLRQYLKSLGQDPASLETMTGLQRLDLARRHFSDMVERHLRQQGLSPELMGELRETAQEDDAPVDAVLNDALAQLDAAGHDTAEIRQALAELDAAAGALAGLGTGAASAAEPDKKQPKPGKPEAATPDEPPPPHKHDAPITRQGLAALLAADAPLQGGDFSRSDLSGMDLSGLDFSDCDLQRANLCGANMERCNLQRALLDKAVLDDAQLSGADMRHASLRHASMRRVTARGLKASDIYAAHMRLHQAQFLQCDFDNVQIRHAHLGGAVFEDCSLSGAIFYMCYASRVSFFRCNLSGASFLAAELNEAELRGSNIASACFARAKARELRLQGVQGKGADFRHAALVNARGDAETFLENARFENADLRSCCWPGASLRLACFDQAWLDNADLNKADLTHASIQRCRMRGANLAKCLLHETDLSDSDMLQGSLRKAQLHRTVLRHCNLHGVDFYKACVHEPVLHNANLRKTLLEGLGL